MPVDHVSSTVTLHLLQQIKFKTWTKLQCWNVNYDNLWMLEWSTSYEPQDNEGSYLLNIQRTADEPLVSKAAVWVDVGGEN